MFYIHRRLQQKHLAILVHKKSSRSQTWEVYVFEFALWRSLRSIHFPLDASCRIFRGRITVWV